MSAVVCAVAAFVTAVSAVVCAVAAHGTAPNIAGKDVVNPCSLILSAVMMLEHFGWNKAAVLIVNALEASFGEGRATHDLARFMPNGVSLGTSDFTKEIIERINS